MTFLHNTAEVFVFLTKTQLRLLLVVMEDVLGLPRLLTVFCCFSVVPLVSYEARLRALDERLLLQQDITRNLQTNESKDFQSIDNLPGKVCSTKNFLKSQSPQLPILGVVKSLEGMMTSLGVKSPCNVGYDRNFFGKN